MRHFLTAFLAAALFMSMAPGAAFAQDGEKPPAPAGTETARPAPKPADDGAEKAPDAEAEAEAAAEAAEAERADPVQRDLSAYRLRVGDRIDVVVYLHEELTRLGIVVPGNGEIAFPPIGKVNLKDKTVFEVGGEIRKRLKDEDFLTDPKVDVLVTGYAPRVVYLLGAVQGTVALPPHKNIRLLELLAMSGSLGNPTADFSRVRILRHTDEGQRYNIKIDVTEILENNDEEKNIIIFEGDYVVVERLEEANPLSSDFVYILGKVRNPGRHPVVKGRTGFSLTKAIALAGDFDEFAERSQITIIRKDDTGRTRFTVDFDEIIEGDKPDVDLRPDDLIYVPESFF